MLARMKKLAALVCAAALASCGSSGSPSESDRMFLMAAASWDMNRDNVVTCDEWKAYAASLFDAADRNRAGVLTPEEFKALEKNDRMFTITDFKYFDVNGNGRLERDEFLNKPNPAFLIADSDRDCRLTTIELTAARNMSAPRPAVSPQVRTER
jgi:hypothetical protein